MFRATKVLQADDPKAQPAASKAAPAPASSGKPITIRVRSKDGTFRFDIQSQDTIAQVKKMYEEQTKVPSAKLMLAVQSKPKTALNDNATVASLGIQHGDMLMGSYPDTIVSAQEEEEEKKRKLREKELADPENYNLRKTKKHWTFGEFNDLVQQNKIVIKPQKYGTVVTVSVDTASTKSFQTLLQNTGYQMKRMGFLYGTTKDDKWPDEPQPPSDSKEPVEEKPAICLSTLVDVIYEPPQENEDEKIRELKDDKTRDKVDALAALYGLKPVGWIVSYSTPREHALTAFETLKAAEYQAKYGDHFVTVTIGLNQDQQVSLEAFQVSKQCVELYQKGLFELDPSNPSVLKTKKKVEVGKKTVTEVECLLLITNTGIQSYNSKIQNGFPVKNRPDFISKDYKQTRDKAKEIITRRERQGQKFVQCINDFHLLLYLAELDILSLKTDFPILIEAIKAQNQSAMSGYEMIIKGFLH